jgi:hypothetical protein
LTTTLPPIQELARKPTPDTLIIGPGLCFQITETQVLGRSPVYSLEASTVNYAVSHSTPPKCKSSSTGVELELDVPENLLPPFVAAVLTPPPTTKSNSNAPLSAINAVHAVLASQGSRMGDVDAAAVFGTLGRSQLRGSAFHAAALAAVHSPESHAPVLPLLVAEGFDVNAKLSVDGEPSHWLNGATPLLLIALLGMHRGVKAQELLVTLVAAGADQCAPLPPSLPACCTVPP